MEEFEEGIDGADFEIEIGQRLQLAQGFLEGGLAAFEGIRLQLMIDREGEPEAELAKLDGGDLEIDAVDDLLDDLFFGFVKPGGIALGGILAAAAGLAEADDIEHFMEEAEGEGPGADGGIAHAQGEQATGEGSGFLGGEEFFEFPMAFVIETFGGIKGSSPSMRSRASGCPEKGG